MSPKPHITELQEFVLSYLVGLGPVGTEIFCPHKWVDEDLRIDHSSFHQIVKKLRAKGIVERARKGTACSPSSWIVLKRPEECEFITYEDLRLQLCRRQHLLAGHKEKNGGDKSKRKTGNIITLRSGSI